jgi:hypothetical protein
MLGKKAFYDVGTRAAVTAQSLYAIIGEFPFYGVATQRLSWMTLRGGLAVMFWAQGATGSR